MKSIAMLAAVFCLACSRGESATPDSARDSAAAARPAATPPASMRVSVGMSDACVIRGDGALFCWGDNSSGQLGAPRDSDTVLAPRRVGGTMTFREAAVGSMAICAIATDGRTFCWGSSDQGQLGTGRTVDSSAAPSLVANAVGFTAVAAAPWSMCALDAQQAAWCWGSFESPPDPSGPVQIHPRPTRVAASLKLTSLAARNFAGCGAATDGAVYCWNGSAASPRPIAGVVHAASVALGSDFGCALDASGAAWCWGENTYGQLGAGGGPQAKAHGDTAIAVAGGHRFRSISAGSTSYHACALDDAGAAWCWGENGGGVLGAASTEQCASSATAPKIACARQPVMVGGGAKFSRLSVGDHEACGVTPDSRVLCWGTPEYPEGPAQTGGIAPREIAVPAQK